MEKIKGINKDGKVVEINGDEWEKFVEALQASTEKKKAPKIQEKRSRRFSLTTYIDREAVESFVSSQSWVQHWAMCTHDRDIKEDGTPKEVHTHILLYTYDAKTSSALRKIFDRFSAELYEGTDKEVQNTMCQVLYDTVYMWRYLVHKDDKDKAQYDDLERICDDFAYWTKLEKSQGMTDSKENMGLQVFNDILDGVTTRELIERYGKDYIYHAHMYKQVVCDYNREESVKAWRSELDKKAMFDITDLFPLLLEGSPFTKATLNAFNLVLDYIKRECLFTYNSKINLYLEDKNENNV